MTSDLDISCKRYRHPLAQIQRTCGGIAFFKLVNRHGHNALRLLYETVLDGDRMRIAQSHRN